MVIITTHRLLLCELGSADATLIVRVLNDPDFLANVGDRGVRTTDDARGYIESGPRASYAEHGFGLWRVDRRDTGEAIGICGLLKRPTLEAPDVGFALLPEHRCLGFAIEAATATLAYARDALQITRVLAIVQPDNVASIAVLRHIGMRPAGTTRLSAEASELRCFETA